MLNPSGPRYKGRALQKLPCHWLHKHRVQMRYTQVRQTLSPDSALSKGWVRVSFHRSFLVLPARAEEDRRLPRLSGTVVTWREARPRPQASSPGQRSLCGESSGVCSKSEFGSRPPPCPYLPLSSTEGPEHVGTESCSATLAISATLCADLTLEVKPKGWGYPSHCTE